ncbi:MAG TPA: hypothetical protein VGG74_21045 [Kofleriaceae bacterium]|jgi:hypothetical protein
MAESPICVLAKEALADAETDRETNASVVPFDEWWHRAVTREPQLAAEVLRLTHELNTPQTANFIDAVRVEAAHQRERWGADHDAGKRPEDWITLYTYLLGKAAKAHFDGDRAKLLHHIITVAAVALNWHANATGEDMRMRPGVDHG